MSRPGEVRGDARGVVVVGRIAEHEVVAASVPLERPGSVLAQDGAAQPQLVEVGVDRAAGLPVRLDERRRGGTA